MIYIVIIFLLRCKTNQKLGRTASSSSLKLPKNCFLSKIWAGSERCMPQSISSLKSQRKERTLLNMGKNHVSQNDMVYLSRKKLSPMIIILNHCWPYGMTSNDWESTGTSRHSHNTRSVPVPRSPPSTSCYFGSCRHQETWHNWKTSTTSTIEIHRSTNRLAEGRGAQSSNIERSTVALKASCATPSGGDGVTVS